MWHLLSWGREVQIPGFIKKNLGQRKRRGGMTSGGQLSLMIPGIYGLIQLGGPHNKSCSNASFCIKPVLSEGTLNPSGDCEILQGGELTVATSC